jgi:hypothetical protein
MLKRLNKTAVTAEQLGDVMKAVAALPKEDRGFEGSTFAVVKYAAEQKLPQTKRQALVLALNFRLAALARLMDAHPLPGFTRPGSDGAEWLHEDVIRCAAEMPLLMIDDDFVFDAVPFREHLLAIATPAGGA